MSLSFPPSLRPLTSYGSAQPNPLLGGGQVLSAPMSSGNLASPALETSSVLLKRTLSNGAQGYCFQKPGLRKSVLVFSFPLTGLSPVMSNLLTALLFDGSPATKRQLAEWERQGIILRPTNTETRLSIRAEAPAGQESALVAAVTRLLGQPVVDPATFNTVKAKIFQNLQSFKANPDALLDTRMAQRLFGPGHPYSVTPQEQIAELSTQTLPSVMAYHPALLQLLGHGQAMMISSLSADSQRQVLNAAVGQLSRDKRDPESVSRSAARAGALDNIPVQSSPRAVLLPNPALRQALIKVLWQAPDPRDPDYFTSCLIQSLLSGVSPNSFLKTLRTDHSLVYGMNRNTALYNLPQGDTYTPSLEVDFSKIGVALADIKQVTQALCQSPISAANLQAVQRVQLLKMREGGETAGALGFLYQQWLARTGAVAPDDQQMQAAIMRVTSADIQRVANRIFNTPNNLHLMGVSAPAAVLQQWFPGQPLEKP
jgi:predicted Zn-dependent peptidase